MLSTKCQPFCLGFNVLIHSDTSADLVIYTQEGSKHTNPTQSIYIIACLVMTWASFTNLDYLNPSMDK